MRKWKILLIVAVAVVVVTYTISISGGCLYGPSFGLKCAVGGVTGG